MRMIFTNVLLLYFLQPTQILTPINFLLIFLTFWNCQLAGSKGRYFLDNFDVPEKKKMAEIRQLILMCLACVIFPQIEVIYIHYHPMNIHAVRGYFKMVKKCRISFQKLQTLFFSYVQHIRDV